MAFLLRLVGNLFLFLSFPLRMFRRARAAPRGAYLEVVVDGAVVEVARSVPPWRRGRQPPSLDALREVVALASDDPRVAGIYLRLVSFSGGSAKATSLRDVLLEARRRGKRVVAYLPHGASTLGYFVATAADQILIGPEASLDVTGFAVEAHYLRSALDRVGVEPEVFARGRYKTAGEFLEKKSMSEPQREQLGVLLDVAHEVLLEALASGRKVERERARRWVDQAPWSARSALASGLVDAVVYEDEVPRTLDASRKEGAPIVPVGRYRSRRRVRFLPLVRPRYLALVEVQGPIVSEAPWSLVPVAHERSICRSLRAVRDDARARGLVLVVSSRGGSALASDRILREVRRVAEKKPVVAYLGDVAASGGYMVAVGAHAIVAQPTTVTGSIGVVAARLLLSGILARVGIATEVVKRGSRADMMSAARPLSASEREHLERHIDEIYRAFLEAVALGRGKPVSEVEPLAAGRVMSGRDARRHGLIDQLGGFDLALGELRARVGEEGERLAVSHVGPGVMRTPGLLTRFVRSWLPLPSSGPLVDYLALAFSDPKARVWALSDVFELGQG